MNKALFTLSNTDNLIWHKCETPMILIGDIVNDRLNINKGLERTIRNNLHGCGAIFILGNHDSTEASKYISDYQKGSNAIPDTASEHSIKQHEKKVFVKAYYDKKNQTIHIHNGLIQYSDNSFQTAFGNVEDLSGNICTPIIYAENPQDLVNKINKLPVNINQFTNFRPDRHNKNLNLPQYKPYGILKKIRIVCGHDGSTNSNEANKNTPVIKINAIHEENFAAIAIHLGSYEPLNE